MGGYACMLCEKKRERGTVWVGVCVGYVERKRARNRVVVSRLCERKRESDKMGGYAGMLCEKKR